MSPNEDNVRKRVGLVDFLVLTKANKVLWFSEAKTYLESLGIFYTIDPSYAEKSVHLTNLRLLAGTAAVFDNVGVEIAAAIPPFKTDEYIDDCNKVKGFLKAFCDIHHTGLLDNLAVKTPKSYWDCLQGIGGNPDLGAANACLAIMFNNNPDATVPETVQAIRTCLRVMENTYGQRTQPISVNEPSVTIKELAGVALIGYLESIPEFSAMCLNSHKLPITTEFETLASDALAHDSRLDRSEKIVAGKATRSAHVASKENQKCTKTICYGPTWKPKPHDSETCFARHGYPWEKKKAKTAIVATPTSGAENNKTTFAEVVQAKVAAVRKEKGDAAADNLLDMLDLDAIKEAQYCSFRPKTKDQIQSFLRKTKLHRSFKGSWKARKTRFLVDSGCSDTLVGQNIELDNEVESKVAINTANGITRANSAGQFSITIRGEEKCVVDTIKVFGLKDNLLSVSQLADAGYECLFTQSGWTATHADPTRNLCGPREGGLYILEVSGAGIDAFNSDVAEKTKKEMAKIWHERLGHASLDKMKRLAKMDAIQGFNIGCISGVESLQCETCIVANLKESKHPKGQARRASRVGEILHFDGKGPLKPIGRDGSKYFLSVVDNYSKFRWSRKCKKRSDYPALVKEIIAEVETQTGKRVVEIRSDNEFRGYTLHRFCKEKGIVHKFTVPHSPAQNGIAERAIGTTMETTRPCLMASGLPLYFWPEAVDYSTFVLNCMPTTSVENKIPHEMYYGWSPHEQFIKPFGASCFGFIPVEKRANKSLGARALKCQYLGPSLDQKGFRLWVPSQRKVMVSRTCVFADKDGAITEFLDSNEFGVAEKENIPSVSVDGVIDDESCGIIANEKEVLISSEDEDSVYGTPPSSPSPELPRPTNLSFSAPGKYNEPLPLIEGRSLRSRQAQRKEARLAKKIERDAARFAMNAFAALSAPLTVKEAERRPDWSLWEEAMKSEMDGLMEMKCYEENCSLPSGAKVVDSKWVFDIKTNPDGSVERYKARLVAKGFSQIGGVHYFETSSPVAQMNSVKIFLSIAAANDLNVHQLDVKQAFLIPELKETLYLKIHGHGGSKIVRLLKCLYGLKQSSFEWNAEAVKKLKLFGFSPLLSDPCIFVRKTEGSICYLALYVDDILIACKDMELLTNMKGKICETWKCRDMGEAEKFLGIIIKRKRGEGLLHLSQPELLRECLHGLNLTDCKPALTPAVAGEHLVKYGELIDPARQELYHSMVGKLLYVANHTRPDLSVAIGQLASFVSNPTESHWQALKRVVRYCKGTLDFGIVLGGAFSVPILVGYADADWGSCIETRRSRTGYTFHLGVGCVSHQSKKQATVALSTAEAEYMALSSATQELKWLRQLLGELGFEQTLTEVFQDNQACVQMAKGNVNHQRSKHIDMRYHFIQEAVTAGEMKLTWIPTSEMVADILTKVLPAPIFLRLRALLNVQSLSVFQNRTKEAVGIA